jgi:O-antigen/teichoic acid export membrane protein
VRALALAAIMAAAARPVAAFYEDPRLINVMLVLAASTMIGGSANPKLVVFTRNLVFWQEFATGVSQKLLGFIVSITIAVIYKSYWALVAGGVAAQLLSVILSYVLIPYRPHLRLRGGGQLLNFSAWLTLGQIVRTANYRSDTLFIGAFLGKGAVGYYTFGDNLASLPTREATSPIAQTLFPAFSRMRSNPVRLRDAYKRSQTLLVLIALPLGFGFSALAEPFIRLAVGEKWLSAVIVIQMLASVQALQTLGSPIQPLSMAMGETRSLFMRDLLNLVIRIPLMLAGIFLAGLAGVVIARSISGLINIAFNLGLAHRLLGFAPLAQIRVNSRSLASVAIMVVCLFAAQSLLPIPEAGMMAMVQLGVTAFGGGVIYTTCVSVMWVRAGRPAGPEAEIVALLARFWPPTGGGKQAMVFPDKGESK